MRFRSVIKQLSAAAFSALVFHLSVPHGVASCPQPAFQTPIVLSGPGFGPGPSTIESGDFNNDGLADLLTADSTGASVFLADGSGHFMNQFSSGTSVGPRAVTLFDVNNDGNLDFAMAYSSNSPGQNGTPLEDGTTLILHLGDGAGNFNSPLALYQSVGGQEDPRAMVAGDFNGDGNADLVVSARDGAHLTWCLGDGQGHFDMRTDGMQYASAVDDPVALGAGDFDGDGKSDLVVHSVHAVPATSTTQQVAFVLFGGGSNGVSGIVRQLSVGDGPVFDWEHTNSNSIAVVDLNGDQKLDIAVQDRSAGAVSIALTTGPRQFGPVTHFPAAGYAIATGDLNDDGFVDLATADPTAEHACVLLGDGTGTFGAATCVPSGGFSTSIAIDRFNNADGSRDIAVANRLQRSAAVLLNACAGPPIDIRATAIEVTQGIQDLTNSVMLIAGKRTYARLHVSANYDRLPVTATLQPLDSNGANLGPELLPANSRALVSVRTSPNRAKLDDAFYFELPAGLTKAGSISLRATVNPLHTVTEVDYSNNSFTSSPLTFTPTRMMKLRVVDYSFKKPNGIVVENDPGDVAKLAAAIKSELPIDSLSFSQISIFDPNPPAVIVDGIDNAKEDADALIAWLQNFRATKEPQNSGSLYYLLNREIHGQAEDLPSLNATGTWFVATHEIGHMLGRRHVNCNGSEGGPDPSYPYPGGKIGGPATDPTRYFGLSSATDRPVIIPSTVGDLMGYCEPRWLSNYNLAAIWTFRENHPQMAPKLRRPQALAAGSSSGDFLAIYGQIDPVTENLSLVGVTRATTVGDIPPLVPGPYHLRFLDEVGTILADHPFQPRPTAEDGPGAIFGQIVDFAAGSREVQIYSDNSARVLTSVPISLNPPTVTITTPIAGLDLTASDVLTLEWIGDDLDGDALHYDVLYSADNGTTWQLVITGLSNESAVIPSTLLGGTGGAGSGYLRVVASDGVLNGSDQAGPMTVADKAPLVQVLHPSTTTVFGFGQTVTLEGWAQDLEDGTLDDSQLTWASSRSGPLGTGRLLHVLDLESGTHTITLSATDREGEVSYASVVVTVGPAVVRNSAPAFVSVSPAITVKEGTSVNLSASANDPDGGQAITVTAIGYPADLTYTPGNAVAPTLAQATVAGVVGYSAGDQNPTTYTIEWLASDGTLAVAASTELSVMDVVPISFELTPGTLNLRSMGRWVTGYLEPTAPYTAADIDTPTVILNDAIPVDGSGPTEIGDYDGDGIPDLMLKFERVAVELELDAGDNVAVVVTGTMAGHYFIGTDHIRVIRAKVTAPVAGATLSPGGKTTVAWTTPSGVNVQSVALLSCVDNGTTWNLVASGLPNVGHYEWDVPNVTSSHARVAIVLVESADETGLLVEGVVGTSGEFAIGNVTAVEENEAPRLALKASRPNPSPEGLRVNFGLPDGQPARLEVFNVTGRRVAAREVGGMGPGFHTVMLDERRTLPSGVYLIRLTQAGRKLTTRVVMVR